MFRFANSQMSRNCPIDGRYRSLRAIRQSRRQWSCCNRLRISANCHEAVAGSRSVEMPPAAVAATAEDQRVVCPHVGSGHCDPHPRARIALSRAKKRRRQCFGKRDTGCQPEARKFASRVCRRRTSFYYRISRVLPLRQPVACFARRSADVSRA